jgi:hypothetical protein
VRSLRSDTTEQIHHQAGTLLVAASMNPHEQQFPALLSQEESTHKEKIGLPAKSDSGKQPQGYYKRNGDMDGQEPLGGKAFDIGPPVPEWNIQYKNKDGDGDKLSHGGQCLFFLFFLRFF